MADSTHFENSSSFILPFWITETRPDPRKLRSAICSQQKSHANPKLLASWGGRLCKTLEKKKKEKNNVPLNVPSSAGLVSQEESDTEDTRDDLHLEVHGCAAPG